MSITRGTRAAVLALLACALPACGSSGGTDPSSLATVQFQFQGLEALGPDFEYEGWVIVDGAPISTGRFTVDGGGMASSSSAALVAPNVANATAFVLTIEPVVDPDPGPAATKILGGDFVAGQATLGVGHAAALGDDFTSATGSFIIATPSSSVMTDEDQGIWWLDPTGPAATLMLPTLPAGWAYEGWVVGGGGPVSTGRFTNPAGPDSDLAGPTGGTDSNGPPFPGQDFVTPPVSLIGQTAVITVEPDPDDSPNPFTMKPLVTMSIGAQLAPTLQPMANNAAATNPTGTASIQ